MPRINTYTDNTSIEDDDKLLTYDTQGAATKLTAFSRIWTWIQSKIHAITASTSAWTASNDKVVVDRNGTLSRIDYSILAKAIVESYNGSTLAGSAQAVKTAIDALNSKTAGTLLWSGSAQDGDEITLSSAVTNFTWLLFIFKTNSEITSVRVRADHNASSEKPYATIQAGDWNTTNNCFQYNSMCFLERTSSTKYTVTVKTNNVNFLCHPIAVYGF